MSAPGFDFIIDAITNCNGSAMSAPQIDIYLATIYWLKAAT
jgi:hypothetical protein